MLVCAGASVNVCVCARARVYTLTIVSMDKILRFTNTLIIINSGGQVLLPKTPL